nr:hypothetical protein [Tanacetum cinerariifolium]
MLDALLRESLVMIKLPLQMTQILYCFVNNIHVDYAELLWEGLHYALKNPSTQIPYPKFIKIIVGHYMTVFPEISRKARDKYHNLEVDAMVKNIFNSGKNKDGVGMKIPNVPMTLSQPIKSTQGTHRTTSAPRLRIPPRSSERLTPPTPIPSTDEADDLVLQDTLQNVEENVKVDSSTVRQNDNPIDPNTRLEPRSDKESLKVELTAAVQPINVNEEEEELVEEDYELTRRDKRNHELMVNDPPPSSSTPSSSSSKISATNRFLSLLKPKTRRFKRYKSFFDELQGKHESLPKMVDDRLKGLLKTQVSLYVALRLIIEREKSQADVAKMIADAIQQDCENLRSEISSQINDAISNHIPSQVDSSVRNYMSDDLPIWLAFKYKFERLNVSSTPYRPSAIRTRDHEDPHDDCHPKGDNSEKRHKTSEHGTFVFVESSSDDDELPTEKVSQDLIGEVTQMVDEAKLRKVVDEML